MSSTMIAHYADNRTMSERLIPVAMVLPAASPMAELMKMALRASGWRVLVVADTAAIRKAAELPALVMIDRTATVSTTDADIAGTIRRDGGPVASVPIVAIVDGSAAPGDCDEVIALPLSAEALAQAAGRWRPDGATAALDRLEATFGSAPIRAMTVQFRALLSEAIAALDGSDAGAIAHRVAGVAGTLGFDAAGRAWLDLSEGRAASTEPARREARRAIATIDRRQNAIDPSTSV